jgi:hypothetical protein
MFFDDEEVSISLFGDREVVQSMTTLKPEAIENSSRNGKVTTTSSNNLSMIHEMKSKNPDFSEEAFAETYCSNVAIQSVLDRTSMSYQIPTRTNYNLGSQEKGELYPSSVNGNSQLQLKPDLQQDRNKRVRTQWEVPNSVYCTHQGLDNILQSSSMAYQCNNNENNFSSYRESPIQESIDEEEDEQYLLAFGRQVDSQQKNQWVEESFTEMYSSPPPPPPPYETYNGFDEQYLDFPPPKVYLEGIDDFDVFTLFPISDDAM